MGIGRGMITSLVAELIEEGAIYSGDTASAPRGRHPEMLFVRTRDRLVVAADIRFSRTYLMLSDFAGRPIATETMATIRSPGDLAAELGSRIGALLDSNAQGRECEGVGLVIPGMVDRATGRVLNSPQLGWRDVDIRDLVAAETNLPVEIENAPIACALARMWRHEGSDPAPQNFVYVTVSDGVGAALVVRGEVVRGDSNAAGEFGHVPLSLDGPECLCGARGCLEAHTSNLATVCRYLGRDFSPATAADVASMDIGIGDVIDRWKSGDPGALRALEETARYLAVGLSTIVNAINPATIFIGGEITDAWEVFEGPIADTIRVRGLTPRAALTDVISEPTTRFPRLNGATALITAPSYAAPRIA